MPIVLTVENVTEALKAVVAEKGENFIYVNDEGYSTADSEGDPTGVRCNYVHYSSGEAQGGCIVAHVLYCLGISFDDMQVFESESAYSMIRSLVREGDITVDGEATNILQRAQALQDEGKSWGIALKRALGEKIN